MFFVTYWFHIAGYFSDSQICDFMLIITVNQFWHLIFYDKSEHKHIFGIWLLAILSDYINWQYNPK